MKKLDKKLKNLPQKPGVYLFKKNQEVIYVGKAKNLKKRVSSYFRKINGFHKPEMIEEINNLDYIITSTEPEALLLEANLVKKHHPKYNVVLKDDKNFLYIKITDEDFPLVTTARRIAKDKAKYFGPYVSAKAARNTLKTLRKIFPFRACRTLPKRPCLLYHLGYCPAPCDNKIKKSEYQRNIEKIVQFLKGNLGKILGNLKEEMKKKAQNREFERAAKLRDQIFTLEKVLMKQKIIYQKKINEDILSLAKKEETAAINLFIIREGKLIDRKIFTLNNIEKQKDKDIFYAFINQYFRQTPNKPQEIILPISFPNQRELERIFKLKIRKIQKGKRFGLIKLGEENALDFIKSRRKLEKEKETKTKKALLLLKQSLNIKNIPRRIEAYDISNIQGVNPVGSMIVFEDGQAKKSDYRKFKIRTVKGISDTAMMAEVLERRFKNEKWPKPDLIILDGGKGQLNAGLKILKKLKIKIPIVAMAKKLEEIFRPNKKNPLTLTQNSLPLYLMQNIRDEAHRFAIGYFRKKHDKMSYTSILDEIPGLGPKTKRKLLDKFGSIENLRKTRRKEIENIIGKKLSKTLKEYL